MLILNDYRAEIETFIHEGVSAFLEHNPGAQPTCVALYCSPVNGWVSLCIDTEKRDLPNTNCSDFSHAEFRLLELPAWAAEYESPHPTVQQHDLSVSKLPPSEGNDTYNESFYLLLMKVSNDYYHHDRDVYRPEWAGVQILDSHFSSFWRVHSRQKNP